MEDRIWHQHYDYSVQTSYRFPRIPDHFLSEVNIPRVIATSVFDFMDGVDVSTPDSLQLDEDWHHFSRLLENSRNVRRPKVEVKQEDAAMIQFAGGTTGIPKGAVLTHANMVAGAYSCLHWGSASMPYSTPEKRMVVCVLPLFHVYANIICMHWAMLSCATMVLVPRFEIDPFMDLLAGIETSVYLPAVPTMINAIVNHPKAAEMNLPKKIDMINSGGGPLPLELIDQVGDLGIAYSEGWGMSETTSLGLANPVMGLRKHGSIGIPFPGVDVRLVDVETGLTEVPQGEPGEMLIKSPTVMKEYWENPEKTAEALKDGWLYTGDIARMDEEVLKNKV